MKIYSNIITINDIWNAFRKARDENGSDIWVGADLRTFRPRTERFGAEFWAYSIHGKRASAHAPIGSCSRDRHRLRAASWSDYGYVMAHLYNVDPHARVGFYKNEADFVEKVRNYTPRGQSLEFLNVLHNIAEYGA